MNSTFPSYMPKKEEESENSKKKVVENLRTITKFDIKFPSMNPVILQRNISPWICYILQ